MSFLDAFGLDFLDNLYEPNANNERNNTGKSPVSPGVTKLEGNQRFLA
jgi:hypothetical protein